MDLRVLPPSATQILDFVKSDYFDSDVRHTYITQVATHGKRRGGDSEEQINSYSNWTLKTEVSDPRQFSL